MLHVDLPAGAVLGRMVVVPMLVVGMMMVRIMARIMEPPVADSCP